MVIFTDVSRQRTGHILCVQESNPLGRPETSVRNYQYSLLNEPEKRISQCTVVIFEVRMIMTMTMKIVVLHYVTPCSLVNSYHRFGGISCRYVQGNRSSFGMLHIVVVPIGVDVSE